jgi:hypothetical protein
MQKAEGGNNSNGLYLCLPFAYVGRQGKAFLFYYKNVGGVKWNMMKWLAKLSLWKAA